MEEWWVQAFLVNEMSSFCTKAIKGQKETIGLIISGDKRTMDYIRNKWKKITTHRP